MNRAGHNTMTPRERSAGFTLIEVILALAIFSVAVIGLIEGVGTATRLQGEQAPRLRATELAGNILEELNYSRRFELGEEEGDFQQEIVPYHWQTKIEESEQAGLRLVTVRVSWEEGSRELEHSVATLMYAPEATQ